MWTWKRLREVLNKAEADDFDLDQPIVLADRANGKLMTFHCWEEALFHNEPREFGLKNRAASMEIYQLMTVAELAEAKQSYIDEIESGWLDTKYHYISVSDGPYSGELCEFVEAELKKRGIKYISHISYGDGSEEYYKEF